VNECSEIIDNITKLEALRISYDRWVGRIKINNAADGLTKNMLD